MRTTKAERKANAKDFYRILQNSGKAVVVRERIESNNPNCYHVRFVASKASVLRNNDTYVIAEGYTLGTEECFFEFFKNIGMKYPIKTCYEDDFDDWVEANYGIKITYDDGYAMIWEM